MAMKRRRRSDSEDDIDIESEKGYRNNALTQEDPLPHHVGLLSRAALAVAAAQWGPWKRLGQLLLVVFPFVWPAALVPWLGWKVFALIGIIITAWIFPGFVVMMTAPDKTPVIQTALRFSWWPVYGIAQLYRWVRDGE